MPKRDTGGINGGDVPTLGQDAHWQQVAQRRYDPDQDDDLTTAIVFAIADSEGVPPIELNSLPLYDVIDVDWIEQAFFGFRTGGNARNGTGSIEFRYTKYLVNVRADGWIHVYEPIEPE